LTSSHTFSHFLRQAKGRPQPAHTFCGKWAFFTPFMLWQGYFFNHPGENIAVEWQDQEPVEATPETFGAEGSRLYYGIVGGDFKF